jgi:uncharacterized protein
MDNLPGFHVLAKPIGPICNLDCGYCFYLEKAYLYPLTGRSAWTMSDDVLDEFVRQYILDQDSPRISFAWQGGEPTLLGVEFFQKVVALQQNYAGGKRIENCFQTNGILLDDRWCQFFAENRFLVGLSIDGPRRLHDRYRVDKGGNPTFDQAVRGIGFLKKHGVDFNTLTVIHRCNSRHPLEAYRFLKEMGSGYMQFIPIVERAAAQPTEDHQSLVAPGYCGEASVTEWSVEPVQYGKFLCAVFDEWVRHDVGRCYVQLFDVALEAWAGMEPSLCVFRRTCGRAMAVEHNGDLYSCDHYVYPAHRLGNLVETSLAGLAVCEQQGRFGQGKWDSLPRYCRECEVLFACNGECPKHRFFRTPDGRGGLNYLCAGYRTFFNHIAPYMKFMADELREGRAPANVMDWIRIRDRSEAGTRGVGRNDPCPCGSGRKYKRCCGEFQIPAR